MPDTRIATADTFEDVLGDLLDDYEEQVVKGLKKEAKKAAKDMVAKTKLTAPKDESSSRCGQYASNIAQRKLSEAKDSIVYVWYVKSPDYRLSHLLEYGHQKVGSSGGRTTAYHFIGDALAEVGPMYERGVRAVVTAIR